MTFPFDTTALSSVDELDEVVNDDFWPDPRPISKKSNREFLAAMVLEASPDFVRSRKRAMFLVDTYFHAGWAERGMPLAEWLGALMAAQQRKRDEAAPDSANIIPISTGWLKPSGGKGR